MPSQPSADITRDAQSCRCTVLLSRAPFFDMTHPFKAVMLANTQQSLTFPGSGFDPGRHTPSGIRSKARGFLLVVGPRAGVEMVP